MCLIYTRCLSALLIRMLVTKVEVRTLIDKADRQIVRYGFPVGWISVRMLLTCAEHISHFFRVGLYHGTILLEIEDF